jgi:hypothetical protein
MQKTAPFSEAVQEKQKLNLLLIDICVVLASVTFAANPQ